MTLRFLVSFEHKDHGHGTSMSYGTIKEVKQSLESMKNEYDCIGIEIILDITELIKE